MRRTFAAVAASSLIISAGFAEDRLVGVRPTENTPEAGLWAVFDKAESEARRKAELNTSTELNEYVRGIACKVAGPHCSETRVYVLDRPLFNAGMAPNGYMEVWSGMLLRTESEAEVAFVLGHETAHYLENHSVEAMRAQKVRQTTALVLIGIVGIAATAAAASAPTTSSANSISQSARDFADTVYLNAVAGYFAFSRAQESEADARGYKAAVEAGYDPGAGAAIWNRLMTENAASDFPSVRKSSTRGSIFDSHPVSIERASALTKLAEGQPQGKVDKERHRAAIRPFLGPWIKDDLRRRDFGQTLFTIDRLAAGGEDLGVLRYYRGEALRLRRKDGDAAAAEAAYREAAQYPDAPAETWRQLADFAERRGEHAETAQLLRTFLEKAPNAADAGFARMRLERANAQLPATQTPPSPSPLPAPAEPIAPAPAVAPPPALVAERSNPTSTAAGFAQ